MIQELMHDPVFLAGKSEVVSKLHISATDTFNLKASQELKQNLEYHRDVVFTTQGKILCNDSYLYKFVLEYISLSVGGYK